MKHGQKGGLHPADCTCGRNGCWSNTTWLKARVARAIQEGKPLPSSWPEKYRNLVVQNAAGEDVATSKDGEIPIISEAIKAKLGPRKPLPLPSETPRTIVTDQVPLRVNIPFRLAAKLNNKYAKEAGGDASAMMDDSQEEENILNEYFQKAFPDIMVGPKLAFVIALVTWSLPAILFWIPRMLKDKLKGMKWPWSKKKPEDKTAVTPPVPEPMANTEAKA